VRLVVHWNFPDSLESYYQEAGRAGRDGETARAVLLYRLEDKRIQTYFLGGKYPRRSEAIAAWNALLREVPLGGVMSLARLGEHAEIGKKRTAVVAAQLRRAGLVELAGDGVIRRGEARDVVALTRVLDAYDRRRIEDRARLAAMMAYAQSTRCRVRMLMEYFAWPEGGDCGRCDACGDRRAAPD
jgi:ATP-dependent DNA helicase RecQ